MSEMTKTTVFAATAAAALIVLMGVTWMSQSWEPVQEAHAMIDEPLFEDFDPLDVKRLEIVKFDEATSTVSPFEVAEVNKKYSIPSHDDYPADAENQLAEAADSVMGRKVLTVESEIQGDHSLYGVVDPGDKDLQAGAVGVGIRVVMKDKDGKSLLAMVIGKEVTGQSGLRYVRRVGQDPVYTMQVSTDKLSTKFEDWIEDDLLKLSTWDIKQVRVRDHSVDEANRQVIQRGDMLLAYDDAGDPKWTMAHDRAFEQGQWVPIEMAENEELDTEKLDALKRAVDDLKIVDVRRKPPGLSADLKAEKDFSDNNKAVASLMNKGFFVAELDGGRVELVSNEGDVRCVMKDGVEYVLRFGNATESTAAASEQEGEDTEPASDPNLNRYIFVMAEFNPDAIPAPELETMPEAPEQTPEQTPEQPAEAEAEQTTETPAEGEAETPAETPAEETAETPAEEAAEPVDIEAERERIEKENQRKQEEYDEKIKAGQEHVTELNARFADWYYIISDDVYRKIHLVRNDIVKQKEPEEDEAEAETTGLPPTHPTGTENLLEQLEEFRQAGPVDE